MTKLRITEIFHSLQGESNTVGIPTVFIRLTGCPLRCHYCDTEYAFKGGELKEIDNILSDVAQFKTQYITVTGGEPLAQKDCLLLLRELCDLNYRVSLETSGAMPLDDVDPRVIKVMDLKTPGSGEADKNLLENFQYLTKQDQIKFVICDENDYHWAVALINEYQLIELSQVLFSPSHGQMDNQQLADWILRDKLPVRFQIQLHKYIWGDLAGV